MQNLKKQSETEMKRCQQVLSREQYQTLDKYIKELRIVKNIKYGTSINYLKILRPFGEFISKPYEDIKFEDIIDFLDSLDVSQTTINNYKIVLKTFYNNILTDDPPGWIKKLKITRNAIPIKTPDELISEADFKRLLKACLNPRDKAIISLMYDLGLRPGEFLELKIKNVLINESGDVYIYVSESKTTERRLKLTHISKFYFLEYFNKYHPLSDNPEAPLWVTRFRGEYCGLAGATFRHLIPRLAKRAGIKKRIWGHLFRHSDTTNKILLGMNPLLINKHKGWSPTSKMLGRYGHLCDLDTDNEINRIYEKSDNEHKDKSEPLVCESCGKENPPDALFCNCGYCFNPDIRRQMDELELKKDLKIDKLEAEIKAMDDKFKEVKKLLMHSTNLLDKLLPDSEDV